jgi:copper homeostasis protein CutC
MCFNHRALLEANEVLYMHFERFLSPGSASGIEAHHREWQQWIRQRGEEIVIISIDHIVASISRTYGLGAIHVHTTIAYRTAHCLKL